MRNLFNPNILKRATVPLTVAGLFVGSMACSADQDRPEPLPTVSDHSHDEYPDVPFPSCAVRATVHGKKASFRLDVRGTDNADSTVDTVTYYFGDGSARETRTFPERLHIYKNPGSYVVNASITMQVAQNAAGVPFKSGSSYECTPATVIIPKS